MKKSLTDLRLDYVDLYLVHFPVGTLPRTDRNQPRQTVPTDHIAVWKVSYDSIQGVLHKWHFLEALFYAI